MRDYELRTEAMADLDGLEADRPDWFERAMRIPRFEWDVDVEGSPVRAYRWGDPERPGVVLIHGFMAHARCLAFIAALLSDRFHVVAYDLSGMGDSPMHPRFAPGLRGRELVAVARDAGLFGNRALPFIVAHSQGAHSGMCAIEDGQEEFAALVVCDMTMMRPSNAEGYFGARRGRSWPPKEVHAHKVHPDLATILARYKLAPPQPCENDFLLEYVARHSVRQLEGDREGDFEGGWVWKFDPRIRVTDGFGPEWWAVQAQRFADLPIRKALVHGEKSRVFRPDSAAYLRELTGGSMPIVEIPDAHHHLMLDQPLAFAAAVRELLESWLADRTPAG